MKKPLAWWTRGALRLLPCFPLIVQNVSAGIGTLALSAASLPLNTGLPRLRRAGPSASLDKSRTIQLLLGNIARKPKNVKDFHLCSPEQGFYFAQQTKRGRSIDRPLPKSEVRLFRKSWTSHRITSWPSAHRQRPRPYPQSSGPGRCGSPRSGRSRRSFLWLDAHSNRR